MRPAGSGLAAGLVLLAVGLVPAAAQPKPSAVTDELRQGEPEFLDRAARRLALAGEEALPVVDALARHRAWEARRLAAVVLSVQGAPRPVARLKALTRDRMWAVRQEALRGLALQDPGAALSAARRALADPVWSVRWTAARTLAAAPALPGEILEALLRRARTDPDPDVRRAARRTLCLRPEPRAVRFLAALFRGSGPERILAARALLRLGRGGSPARPRVLQVLRAACSSEAPETAALACRVLQLLGGSPPLTRALVRALLESWRSGTGTVRAAAEAALRSGGRPAARAALGPALATGPYPIAAYRWLLAALGPAAGAALARAALEPTRSRRERERLLEALAQTPGWGPGELLAPAYLRDRGAGQPAFPPLHGSWTAPLRQHLFAALTASPPREGWVRLLSLALTDPDPSVRRAAALQWLQESRVTDPFGRLLTLLATRPSDYFGPGFWGQVGRLRSDAAFRFLERVAGGEVRGAHRALFRRRALQALAAVDWPPPLRRRAAAWARSRLEDEEDPGSRLLLITLVEREDPAAAVPWLARLAQEGRSATALGALRRLGRLGPPAASRLRSLARRHPDPGLRAEALRLLFRLGLPEDRPSMIQALRRGTGAAREAALRALARTGVSAPGAVALLRRISRNGLLRPHVRVLALRALARSLGREGAEELLRRVREDVLPELRVGALEALTLLAPEAYLPRLLHYLRALADAAATDSHAAERLRELLPPLAGVTHPEVTRFLLELLFRAWRTTPGGGAGGSGRLNPVQAVAAALLGHPPDLVRRELVRARKKLSRVAPSEEAIGEVLELLFLPAHRNRWQAVVRELARWVLRLPPAGSRWDERACRIVADQALAAGDGEEAARALRRWHRILLLTGFRDRLLLELELGAEPLERARPLARIAAALGQPDAERLRAVADAVAVLPWDRQVVLQAVRAAAPLRGGLEQALAWYRGLGWRAPGDSLGAAAALELGLACLRAGRKREGVGFLRRALADDPGLIAFLRTNERTLEVLTPQEREQVLRPTGKGAAR